MRGSTLWSLGSLLHRCPPCEHGMYQTQASVKAIERMVDIHEKQAKCIEGLVNQQYKSALTLSLKYQFLGEIC